MKKVISAMLSAAMALGLAACGSQAGTVSSQPSSSAAPQPSAQAVSTVQLAGLKGPTTMGMVNLNTLMENGTAAQQYDVSMLGTADEIVPQLVKGEVDIAAIPANLAAALYQKTEGGIQALAVNTLGVLYVVEQGDTVHSVQDLKGKTVLSTGKGTTPEYVLRHILEKNGIDPDKDLQIEYCSEATEVTARMAEASDAIAVLPQPYVTAAQSQIEGLNVVLNLTEEWNKVSTDSDLVTGVLVARTEFIEQNEAAFEEFLKDYQSSIEWVNSNTADAAELVANYGIVAKAPLAQKALPACNITYVDGAEMKTKLSGYLQVLFDQNPKAVGGAMPGDDFYYGA